MTRDIFIQNLWRWKCNMPEIENVKYNISELQKTEWSNEFEQLMRNRLIIGAFRYGRFHQDNKLKYDHISSIIERAQKYSITYNQEYLVDIANIALCEFVEPSNNKAYFQPINDGEHIKTR